MSRNIIFENISTDYFYGTRACFSLYIQEPTMVCRTNDFVSKVTQSSSVVYNVCTDSFYNTARSTFSHSLSLPFVFFLCSSHFSLCPTALCTTSSGRVAGGGRSSSRGPFQSTASAFAWRDCGCPPANASSSVLYYQRRSKPIHLNL